MDKSEIWPVIHAERKVLAADLQGLSADQWSSVSLCGEWSVRDVTAHMTAAAVMTPPEFFVKLGRNGFKFSRLQARDIARERGASTAETLTRFEAVVNSTRHPPGPADSWLGETIIHGEDIRRPLGITREYPAGAVARPPAAVLAACGAALAGPAPASAREPTAAPAATRHKTRAIRIRVTLFSFYRARVS